VSRYDVRPEGRLVQALPIGAEEGVPESSTVYAVIDIHAPERDQKAERRPLNLSLVLDRSGSMSGEKIRLAREAALQAIASLRNEDRFAVVVFDHGIDLLAAAAPAESRARQAATSALRATAARGNTDLCGGWLKGCEEAARGVGAEAVTRVLLLTDGQANTGETDHDVIEKHAAELNKRGVVTSTIGVGSDYDERLLGRMAVAGGGNAYFLEQAAQIGDTMASEVGEAAEAVARNVRIILSGKELAGAFSPSWGQFSRETDGTWSRSIGQFASGEERNEVVEILLLPRPAGATTRVTFRLVDDDGVFVDELVTLHWTFATEEEVDAEKGDPEVRLEACRARASAVKAALYSEAHYEDAEKAIAELRREAEALLRRARGDGRIRTLSDELIQAAAIVSDESRRSDRRFIKGSVRENWYGARGRTSQGYARRRGRLDESGIGGVDLVLFESDGTEAMRYVERAAERIRDAVYGRFRFGYEIAPMPVSRGGRTPRVLEPEAERRRVERAGRFAQGRVGIVVTDRRLADNWFSHWHEADRTAVVSTAGWATDTTAPPEAFAAYELLLHGLRTLGKGWVPEELAHAHSNGCLFDFCKTRREVDAKLHVGEICRTCRRRLEEAGFDIQLAADLAALVGEIVAGRSANVAGGRQTR